MAKDPAFLFYSGDFLIGTMFFTDEQVGKYIRLLCAQHQMGRLSENDMLNICKSYDERVFGKFTKEDGKYFNERLEFEAKKRSDFSNSRKKNRMKGIETLNNKEKKLAKKTVIISLSYVEHMENENEIENEYRELFRRWVSYKISRKENYKTLESLQTCYKKLYKISEGRSLIAAEIINDAIAANYAGFFKQKQVDSKENKPTKLETFQQDSQKSRELLLKKYGNQNTTPGS